MTRFTDWAGHAVKRTGWVLDPRAALSGLALVGGLALLAAFYLALTSHTAVLGRLLQEMDEEREAIVHENAYLRDQIARATSAATLMERARAEHFVFTSTVLFVPVAFNPIQGDEQSPTPP